MDKLQFLSYLVAVILSITVYFVAFRIGRAIMLQHTKIELPSVQMICEISFFRLYRRQLAIRPLCLIFKSVKFYLLRCGGSRHITMPNFVKIAPFMAEIL